MSSEIERLPGAALDNAAKNLLHRHGNEIRKHNVSFAIDLSPRTAKMAWRERESLTDRIWYRVKKLLKEIK